MPKDGSGEAGWFATDVRRDSCHPDRLQCADLDRFLGPARPRCVAEANADDRRVGAHHAESRPHDRGARAAQRPRGRRHALRPRRSLRGAVAARAARRRTGADGAGRPCAAEPAVSKYSGDRRRGPSPHQRYERWGTVGCQRPRLFHCPARPSRDRFLCLAAFLFPRRQDLVARLQPALASPRWRV